MKRRLLFLSNLFPTEAEPYRGLDNATLLHALSAVFDIRVLSPRASLPWTPRLFVPRPCDANLHPQWVRAAYLPKLGGPVNHLLMAASIRSRFEAAMREFQPEVILGSWIFPDCCAATLLADGRVPVVAIAQGSDIHQYLTMSGRRRVILKWLPRAYAVITRSRELARTLEAAAFPPAKLRAVYNGVDLQLFQPRDQGEARRAAGLPLDAKIMLFVGNFFPVKNPAILISALPEIIAKTPEALLVMAGGGPLESVCRAAADNLGIRERVIFVGRKRPEEVARLMNAADLLALPSWNEGVPNVLLEAFASGLPVVASETGGIPEVLDAPALGRLVRPGELDALAGALREQLETPRDAAAIRRHAEGFSWQQAAAAYSDILLESLR